MSYSASNMGLFSRKPRTTASPVASSSTDPASTQPTTRPVAPSSSSPKPQKPKKEEIRHPDLWGFTVKELRALPLGPCRLPDGRQGVKTREYPPMIVVTKAAPRPKAAPAPASAHDDASASSRNNAAPTKHEREAQAAHAHSVAPPPAYTRSDAGSDSKMGPPPAYSE